MSDDPVDRYDGNEHEEDEGAAVEPEATGVESALDRPPEGDPAEHLERRARLAEDRLTEVLAAYRQVRTENEGFRERVTRDVERSFDRRRERLLLKFIDILDNLDRALEAAEQSYAGTPLIEGLILVRTQLLQTLQQEGLERIPVLGLPFDPAVSEAVGTQPVTDPDHDGVVVKELFRGYRLHGRVARASRVFIGEYREGNDAGDRSASELIGGDEEPSDPGGPGDPGGTDDDTVALDERDLLASDEEDT